MINIGTILLCIWLIINGLKTLFNFHFANIHIVTALLALAAGGLILVGEGKGRPPRNIGLILLASWLLLTGLMPLFNIYFSGSGTILALLAIAAGALILLKK